MEEISSGTIHDGEYHPAANSAKDFVAEYIATHPMIIESMASAALAGNRTAEICSETIHRLITGQPVSDRYVLGLAWTLKEMESEP